MLKIKRKTKEEKAITLIALVVTIIILIILAAVSINLIFGGNGIISRTHQSVEQSKKSQYIEDINLEIMDEQTDRMITPKPGIAFISSLEERLSSERKEWIKNNMKYTEDMSETSENDFENEVLVITSKEGFVIKIDVDNTNNIATIDESYSENEDEIIAVVETSDEYFKWSTDGTTVQGLSDAGLAAYNAGNLTELVIPKKHGNVNVTSIAASAFQGKNKITKLVIQDNITQMARSNEFQNCTGITDLTLPINLRITGAFNGCSGITKVHFTKGTTNEAKSMVAGEGMNYATNTTNGANQELTPWYLSRTNNITVTFENGITKIGSNMFYNCSGLKIQNINKCLPSTLTQIGSSAFYNCDGLTGKIEIKGNLNVGGYAFYDCDGITEVKVDHNLTESNIFAECSEITKIEMTDNVTSILHSGEFYNCKKLTDLTLPINLKMTGAFNGCDGITKVHFTKGTTDTNSSIVEGVGVNYATNTIKGYNQELTPWYISKANNITVTFGEGITKIGNNMFYGCTGLKIENFNTWLPSTVTQIGYSAFYNCDGLTGKIEIKGNLNVGGYAFYDCDGITEVKIDRNITDGNIFAECSEITKLEITDNVTSIYRSSEFYNCKKLVDLTLPINLRITGAFNGCTGITKVHFTKGTTNANNSMVAGQGMNYATNTSNGANQEMTPWYISKANNITVTFGEGITKIGNNMFYNCTGLSKLGYGTGEYTSITALKNAMTGLTVGDYAFYGTQITN